MEYFSTKKVKIKNHERHHVENLELWALYFIEVKVNKSYKIPQKQLVVAVNKIR